jgi:hypothetical protein
MRIEDETTLYMLAKNLEKKEDKNEENKINFYPLYFLIFNC